MHSLQEDIALLRQLVPQFRKSQSSLTVRNRRNSVSGFLPILLERTTIHNWGNTCQTLRSHRDVALRVPP